MVEKGLLEKVIFELKLGQIGIYRQEDKDKEMVHVHHGQRIQNFYKQQGRSELLAKCEAVLGSGPSTGGFNGVVLSDILSCICDLSCCLCLPP